MLWKLRPGLLPQVAAMGGAAGPSNVTLDAGTVTAVTLSGGNLAATNTGTTSTDQGAHVVTTSGKSTSKYYFEYTITTVATPTPGANVGFGIGTTASTYTNLGNSATTGGMVYTGSGNIWANGGSSGKSLGGLSAGDVIGVAVDITNLKIWFKKVSGTPGNWNGDAAANPATNTNGVAIAAGTYVPFVVFGGSNGNTGNKTTCNFGDSAFTGSAPSGFTAGWPP